MSLKTETRLIAGVDVEVTQFAALHALEMANRVAKAYAVALLNGYKLSDPTSVLFADMSSSDFRALAVDLLRGATVTLDGKRVLLDSPEKINRVFAGNLKGLIGAATFVAEVNFGDFFDDASGALNASPTESEDEGSS